MSEKMLEKRVTVTLPEKHINASDLLSFVTKALKEHLDNGWKIGGVVHNQSLEKEVILYKVIECITIKYYPESSFRQDDDLIYSVRQNRKSDGSHDYSGGLPVMVNDVTIRVQKAFGSEIPDEHLKALTEYLCKEANNWLFDQYGFQSK